MDTGDEKPTILIVEDDQIISRIVEMKLMESGYAVFPVVISGEDAICSAVNDLPGVILMDITLQGRIDGIEAARVIDALFQIPTIFVTSHEDDQTVAEIATTSAATFLKKPFKLTDLLTNVEIISRNARHMRRSLGIGREEFENLSQALTREGTGALITRPDGSILYASGHLLDYLGLETPDLILSPLSKVMEMKDEDPQAPTPDCAAIERFFGVPSIRTASLAGGRGDVRVYIWKMSDPDDEQVGDLLLFSFP